MARTLELMSGTACVLRPKDLLSMMWTEGVGWLGGWPTCKGTKARNQCQEPLVSCYHRAWIEATCCSQRREIQTAKCRGTNAETTDGEPCRSCNHAAWDSELDIGENIEMIGEREIMIDVFWSRASEKKERFPLSCPQAAPQRRGSAIRRSCIVAALEVSAYILPATSWDAARLAWGNPSCY